MHALQTHGAGTCTHYKHTWPLPARITDTCGCYMHALQTHTGLLHARTWGCYMHALQTHGLHTYGPLLVCTTDTRGAATSNTTHTQLLHACTPDSCADSRSVSIKKFFGMDHQNVFFGFEWQRFPRYLCSICSCAFVCPDTAVPRLWQSWYSTVTYHDYHGTIQYLSCGNTAQ